MGTIDLNGIWETRDRTITLCFMGNEYFYFNKGKDHAKGTFTMESREDILEGEYKLVFSGSPVEMGIWSVVNENEIVLSTALEERISVKRFLI